MHSPVGTHFRNTKYLPSEIKNYLHFIYGRPRTTFPFKSWPEFLNLYDFKLIDILDTILSNLASGQSARFLVEKFSFPDKIHDFIANHVDEVPVWYLEL